MISSAPSVFGPNASAAFARAAERARLVLKAGDRVRLTSRSGARPFTVTFDHWGWLDCPEDRTCDYFSSRSTDELHPYNIDKVNGVPTSFRDERGQAAIDADHVRFRAEKAQRWRSSFRFVTDLPPLQDTGERDGSPNNQENRS